MPLPDFTEEEHAEVVQAIRAAIDSDRYVLSPRVKRLKCALAKLDPASAERTVTPFAPPKPSGTPSLVYQRADSLIADRAYRLRIGREKLSRYQGLRQRCQN